ncbi:hypothetical protein MPER_14946, partial [Moniliophthora perniciosa FA553]
QRRIYTDDSDPFLCALHAGFVTWSGARKARELKLDMCLRLRVVRCLKGWAKLREKQPAGKEGKDKKEKSIGGGGIGAKEEV